MQKKHITLLVVFNVFLVFLGCIIVWGAANKKISSLSHTIDSRIGKEVGATKKSDFLALQSSLIDTIAKAKQSVVSISISKDIKFYVEDPSQLNGPGNIQQQTAKV
jgi:hypothetical protein